MKKVFGFGSIDYNGTGRTDCPITVKVTLEEKGGQPTFTIDPQTKERHYTGEYTPQYLEFTACGNIWNPRQSDVYCAGQCLDTIAEYVHDPIFTNTIYPMWQKYHLNGMHPECEHQRALGWREKARESVKIYHFRLTRDASKAKSNVEKLALDALRNGTSFTPNEEQRQFANLQYAIETHLDTLPENIAQFYEPKKPLYAGDKGAYETKTLGWLRESEHPEGLLCRPCPVCGYKYGTEWRYMPFEPEDLVKIQALFN